MQANIPKSAKRVFKGKIFDVFQWEQKQFDGSVKTFEAIKRVDTVEIIPVMHDGKIVIANEIQPNMTERLSSLISGRVDKGESALDAAKRELKEEAGIGSEDWELWKTYNAGGSNKIDWKVHVFIARGCIKTSEPILEAGEDIELLHLSFDEFIKEASKESFWSVAFSADVCRMMCAKGKLHEFKSKLFQ